MRSPEPEPYKDKIELSLDGRQVFYLFFGGAVIACLVFVLGVMVGRRVEARAHIDRASTSAARDPLAALDQLDGAGDEMQFRSALAGGKVNTEVDEAIASIERTRKRSAVEEEPALADDEEPKAEPADKKKDDKKAEKEKAADKKAEAKKEAKKAPEAGRFTLQLSSFKEKAEAEAFMASVEQAGYRAYVVEADVEGKGTFYRVRFGEYESYQAAIDAKADFEEKVQKIAYVTRL
jgi:cell division septation protein DedD